MSALYISESKWYNIICYSLYDYNYKCGSLRNMCIIISLPVQQQQQQAQSTISHEVQAKDLTKCLEKSGT